MSGNNARQFAAPANTGTAGRKSRTRRRIVTESTRLFLAQGYENVSVDNIVSATGIARSSFYRFFSNRSEVLAAIIRPVFESGITMMKDIGQRPPRQIMEGILGMYLQLWTAGPDAMRLATRCGGVHFKLFQDVHAGFRHTVTDLLRVVEKTGVLLNDSGEYSARLMARSAVPVLEIYSDDPHIDSLFRATMRGLLLKPRALP